ncbi:GatB/YqeY domain-containing protein [Pandoraea communis]|uniref:Glutamyl-tRNA amidotransferase n=1 Tax=Pandoraea communis TaxID=2508297 RepID=A0A5E4YGA1_9BURK|nr:GatB/YqeY domain-containing protein [Pandoraea communis]MDM8356736.1 GatB/YqeY domain-containing protein [Pandoraea communis]VVE47771.1 glutamyl-tRNA amidotransferase [Pandoraea communis]
MSLKERINEDMKTAMRAKAADKLGTIRLLLAAIKQKEVDERISLDDDAAVVVIVDKLIKQRKDSISQFQAAGRTDLADKEAAELEVLQVYMPQQLSADEVAQAVKAAVAQTGAAGPQDMGKVMGVLKGLLAGRADMTAVSAQVKAALAA